ncbi:hypothetical protein [Curtobacterium flaccumfaciens]|uniref:hypothetical protein n=1 Tax=Curtobacterium flaccumfaciens TaxID=2035 RepID=UPI00188D1C6F|nr:hypothetical protein [Curtobacterium flaccumfaciens]MBF4629322.1 hypothetical protein [Curtobacterium flaccumfaciens]
MAKPAKGDTVVATKNIGGIRRPNIPKGTKGVVTKSSWGQLEVLFTIEKWHGGKEQHEIDVTADEIA